MGKDKNSKSFEIALSGISCAIAVAVLPLGIMTGVGSLTAAGYSVAVLAIMLPLSKQFFKEIGRASCRERVSCAV